MNNLTHSELISIAERDATTDLEHELLRRLVVACDANESLKHVSTELTTRNERISLALSRVRDELEGLTEALHDDYY